MGKPSKKENIGDMATKFFFKFFIFMSLIFVNEKMLYIHVRKSQGMFLVVIIFATAVNFKHTEGPFIHSPTL